MVKNRNETDELIEIIYRKDLNLLLVSGTAFRSNRLSSIIEASKTHLKSNQRLTVTVNLNMVDSQATMHMIDWINVLNDINQGKSSFIKVNWLVSGNDVPMLLLGKRLEEMAQFSFQVAIN